MPVRKYKPTSPGRRFMSVSTFDDITKSKPEKALTEKLTKKLSVTAHSFSATAREKITAAGGSATALKEPKDPRKKKSKAKPKPVAAEEPEVAETEDAAPAAEEE